MAKLADFVNTAITDIASKIREIKESDEQDLGSISSAFDKIAQRADKAASALVKANEAFTETDGETGDDEGQEDQQTGEGDEGQEDQQADEGQEDQQTDEGDEETEPDENEEKESAKRPTSKRKPSSR